MKYLGDYAEDATVDFAFNTHVSGTPTTLGGTPALSVYKADGTTQATTGPTLTADFDGVTGLNHVRVATTDSFYAPGNDYRVVITTGTVGGNSVVGVVVAEFSIENRNISADVASVNGVAAGTSDGTATAGGASTITLATGVTFGTNFLKGRTVTLVGGTGAGQSRLVVSNTNANPSVVTVNRAWDAQPDSTTTYVIDGSNDLDAAGVRAALGMASADLDTQLDKLDTIDDFLDTEVAEILSRIGSPSVSLAADVAALNDLSAAEVNAEVVDALSTDTYAEPGQGAPGATISLAAKINWLYTSWRNKKDNDGSTTNLYADDGSTVIAKQSTSSAGGTVEKAEWITGA